MANLLVHFPEMFEKGCIFDIVNKHTFILDDSITKKGIFVSGKDKFHLHIEKKHANALTFMQNDKCMMNDADGKQCDFLIFDTETVCFSEIKATKENLSIRRKTALLQIENTIKFYFDKNLFKNYPFKKALITFDNNKRIAPQASQSTKRKAFKIKYNVDLNEGNYLLFE